MTQKIQNSQEIGKQCAAEAAVKLIQNGMLIGLGSGSTSLKFVEALAKRGLKIHAVATSKTTLDYANKLGIKMVDLTSPLDLAIDGADEIDDKKQMIKGGGGALLREKIIATSAKEMIVIVDSTKWVKKLGAFPLPVEIEIFGYKETQRKIFELGFSLHLRMKEKKPFTTDGGNYIVDLPLTSETKDLSEIDKCLKSVPGVIETGLFLTQAGRVYVGYPDGSVKTF